MCPMFRIAVLDSTSNDTWQGYPNPAHETIPSSYKNFLSVVNKNIYETFVDLVECNISQNIHTV